MLNQLLKIPMLIAASLVLTVNLQAQVDYSSEIQPIFTNNCKACHIDNKFSGVDLSSYNSVMNSVGDQYGVKIVSPGNPDESPIVDKIEPSPENGVRMPQGGPYLSSEQIQKIRDWIEEGANETPTAVETDPSIPGEFKLRENYPNPFNPSTTLSFSLPRAARYEINVFDLKGRKVWSTGGNSGAGAVEASVLLEQQPSSVYVYRVRVFYSNGQSEQKTGKMMLVK